MIIAILESEEREHERRRVFEAEFLTRKRTHVFLS
jgi:hypothetical protein